MPISPNDWHQIEALIDRVLDAPPEARAALIAELSGSEAARAELERLVAECERVYPLLDRPVAERFAALLESETVHVPAVLAERYRIVRELGRGGMALVYLAHDAKHDRDVAVKVVRPELAATLGRARFLREIAIAARLKHPHIVPLFDSGEVDGLLFYVMPYQEEQSLRERLRRDGALSIEDSIAILSDVCDALAYAHRQGVVHRDIKPDNILLSGRHALVTDFGVARAVTAASEQETLTTAGGIVGTAAYMAPEQQLAGAQIDHRTDIYAVGVMAYEMLVGRRPFSGDTPPSQRAGLASRASADLTTLRDIATPALVRIVTKCLETSPAARYQHVEEVLAALDGPATTPARRIGLFPTRIWKAAVLFAVVGAALILWSLRPMNSRALLPRPAPRLAVLVFQHSGNAELEPLATALTENLIGALGAVPGLVVRSLPAVLPYRDSVTPLAALARRLDVTWVVSGSVSRMNELTTVSVQLTDATSGQLIARSGATAPTHEDVRLIEDLVPKVAALLRERVGDHVRVEGWRAGTRSDVAFASMSRAYKEARDANELAAARDIRGAWMRFRRADSALASASQADPRWIEPLIERAWIARNTAYALFGSGVGIDSIPATLARGINHAETARRLNPNEPRVLEAYGMLLYARSVLEPPSDSTTALRSRAEGFLSRASDADTTLAGALTLLAAIHFARGSYEQAHLLAARAYAADAYYERPQQALGNLFTYSFEDREDVQAAKWCTSYKEAYPQDWFSGYCRLALMVWDATHASHVDSAWTIADKATAFVPKVIRSAVGAQLETLVAGVIARSGLTDSAQRVLDGVRHRVERDSAMARGPFGPQLLEMEASVRLRLGQQDAAVTLLREYLARYPERRARLERSRRFADLPIERLRDAKGGGPD